MSSGRTWRSGCAAAHLAGPKPSSCGCLSARRARPQLFRHADARRRRVDVLAVRGDLDVAAAAVERQSALLPVAGLQHDATDAAAPRLALQRVEDLASGAATAPRYRDVHPLDLG